MSGKQSGGQIFTGGFLSKKNAFLGIFEIRGKYSTF